MKIKQSILVVSLLLTKITLSQSAVEIAEKTIPLTVSIIMKDKFKKTLSLGSGFIVGKGKVITNVHVITGAFYGEIIEDNTKKTHKIEGYTSIDKLNDLVLLSVPTLEKNGLQVSNSIPKIGQKIYAIGNPIGMSGTISEGIVSAIRLESNIQLIQITAPISPGSSGGPVINDSFEVIGVSVASLTSGQNLNFAVPGKYVNDLITNDKNELKILNIPEKITQKTTTAKNTAGVFFSDLVWEKTSYIEANFNQYLKKVSITNGTENAISDVEIIAIVYKNNLPIDYFEFTMFKNTKYGNEDLGFGPISPFLGKSIVLEDRTFWDFRCRTDLDFMFSKDFDEMVSFRILNYRIIEQD